MLWPVNKPSHESNLWCGAGVWYMACCLAGVCVGFWPQTFFPDPRETVVAPPLPALATLAVAQATFWVIIHPLVLLRRQLARQPQPSRAWHIWIGTLRSAVIFMAGAPFYVAAWYLSDATLTDVLRCATYVASLVPLSWAAAMWFGGRWRSSALIGCVVVALGLPWAFYIVLDFMPGASPVWLWHLAPLTASWSAAAVRQASLLPSPEWSVAVWPLAALTLTLGRAASKRRT
jgi:hypothetical protein